MNSVLKIRLNDLPLKDSPLLRDLSDYYETDDIVEWVDCEGQRLASLGKVDKGYINVVSEKLRQERNILRVFRDDAISADACIVPQEDFYRVHYRIGVKQHLRFAMAHEIGHTYWFKAGGGGQPLSSFQRRVGEDPEIEWLCNRFASALLMPRDYLFEQIGKEARKLIGRIPLLHLIPSMARFFFVSEEVAARRLVYELFSRNEAILSLKHSKSRREREGEYFEVEWCVTPQPIGHKFLRINHALATLENQLIPVTALPADSIAIEKIGTGTQLVELDARWAKLCKPMSSGVTKRFFSDFDGTDERVKGFIARLEDRVLLSIPL